MSDAAPAAAAGSSSRLRSRSKGGLCFEFERDGERHCVRLRQDVEPDNAYDIPTCEQVDVKADTADRHTDASNTTATAPATAEVTRPRARANREKSFFLGELRNRTAVVTVPAPTSPRTARQEAGGSASNHPPNGYTSQNTHYYYYTPYSRVSERTELAILHIAAAGGGGA